MSKTQKREPTMTPRAFVRRVNAVIRDAAAAGRPPTVAAVLSILEAQQRGPVRGYTADWPLNPRHVVTRLSQARLEGGTLAVTIHAESPPSKE